MILYDMYLDAATPEEKAVRRRAALNFMENLQFVAGSAASISPLVIIDYPLDRQYQQLREQVR